MAERENDVHERRRTFLVQALTTGLLIGGAGWNARALASVFGKLPGKMPDGRSVFEIKGSVRINGQPLVQDTLITADSRIETDAGSHAIIAVGDGAFIIREKSVVEMSGRQLLITGLQMLSGALLTVFGHRSTEDAIKVTTPVATIGIRGTGFYTEATPDQTYFCTCYGRTVITSTAGSGESEEIVSKHHDAPRIITAEASGGRRIAPGPFKNHTDLELMTLEALCGRVVPFVISGDNYEGPRKSY